MGHCKILHCNTKRGEQNMFNVPHQPSIRKQWISQIQRHQIFDHIPIAYPICALHFKEDEIVRSQNRTMLKKQCVPTIFPNQFGEWKYLEPEPEAKESYLDNAQKFEMVVIKQEPMDTNKWACGDYSYTAHNTGKPAEGVVEQYMQIKQEIKVELDEDQNVEENQNTNSSEAEPKIAEIKVEPKMVTITREEYARLLHIEVQLIKYKELNERKSKQLKKLQDQVAYYKKELEKRKQTAKSKRRR